MEISIITPSYNMLSYLELCAASIADQEDVDFEHIVIDGASTDGTAQWLAQRQGIKYISEKDNGMYDAVNKGLLMAKGDILAYLNCDEQYLPGTLASVKEYFDTHPDVDMVFGDMLLTRPDGSLIAYRKSYRPRRAFILSSFLYVPTCTMFFRRKLVDDGVLFDLSFRANADADFVVRVLQHKYKVDYIRKYFSLFTLTGQNLSADAVAAHESRRMFKAAPAWIRLAKPLLNLARLTTKWLSGAYSRETRATYSVYVNEPGGMELKSFTADNPSYKWQWE